MRLTNHMEQDISLFHYKETLLVNLTEKSICLLGTVDGKEGEPYSYSPPPFITPNSLNSKISSPHSFQVLFKQIIKIYFLLKESKKKRTERNIQMQNVLEQFVKIAHSELNPEIEKICKNLDQFNMSLDRFLKNHDLIKSIDSYFNVAYKQILIQRSPEQFQYNHHSYLSRVITTNHYPRVQKIKIRKKQASDSQWFKNKNQKLKSLWIGYEEKFNLYGEALFVTNNDQLIQKDDESLSKNHESLSKNDKFNQIKQNIDENIKQEISLLQNLFQRDLLFKEDQDFIGSRIQKLTKEAQLVSQLKLDNLRIVEQLMKNIRSEYQYIHKNMSLKIQQLSKEQIIFLTLLPNLKQIQIEIQPDYRWNHYIDYKQNQSLSLKTLQKIIQNKSNLRKIKTNGIKIEKQEEDQLIKYLKENKPQVQVQIIRYDWLRSKNTPFKSIDDLTDIKYKFNNIVLKGNMQPNRNQLMTSQLVKQIYNSSNSVSLHIKPRIKNMSGLAQLVQNLINSSKTLPKIDNITIENVQFSTKINKTIAPLIEKTNLLFLKKCSNICQGIFNFDNLNLQQLGIWSQGKISNPLDDEKLLIRLFSFQSLKVLHMHPINPTEKIYDLSKLVNLKQISIRYCFSFNFQSFRTLPRQAINNIQLLSIISASRISEGLYDVVAEMLSLKYLSFGDSNIQLNEIFKLKSCVLQYINLSHTIGLTNYYLKKIIQKWPRLKVLDIRGCYQVTKEIFQRQNFGGFPIEKFRNLINLRASTEWEKIINLFSSGVFLLIISTEISKNYFITKLNQNKEFESLFLVASNIGFIQFFSAMTHLKVKSSDQLHFSVTFSIFGFRVGWMKLISFVLEWYQRCLRRQLSDFYLSKAMIYARENFQITNKRIHLLNQGDRFNFQWRKLSHQNCQEQLFSANIKLIEIKYLILIKSIS